jgi:hypothetical protein
MNQTLVLIVDRREDAITPLLNQVRFMINIIMEKDFSFSGHIKQWFMN